MCSGPDSDLAHLEKHLAALHRDFPESRRCTVEDVTKILFVARRPGRLLFSEMMMQGSGPANGLLGDRSSITVRGTGPESDPEAASRASSSGLGEGVRGGPSTLATPLNPWFCDDSDRTDTLPFVPTPHTSQQLAPPRPASSSAALHLAIDIRPELAAAAAAAVGWGGCGGAGWLADEVARSRLLLAHYSILQTLLPAHGPVLLSPAFLGGFPSLPPPAFAGGCFDGGLPAASLDDHRHLPQGMTDASLAACSPMSGGGCDDEWRGGYVRSSWD
jgi:hypothetical protein